MEIQAITHDHFTQITSEAVRGELEIGCAWYATVNRQVAGRVFLALNGAFRFSVVRLVGCKWKVNRPRRKFDRFDDAEIALHAEIDRIISLKAISLRDVAVGLRYGRGRPGNCSAKIATK
ncbi:hypothetical protein PLANPX_2681 [Lacipirellula parvula]|uniref:Uncharacterized protein n=1 Tax=Lacipirellula parvula TaxID=2650471 RepID=A0A5K7XJL1_9BACT|nr:hypothetical protein PLANPX_2681 [Lacipirellula parvula]